MRANLRFARPAVLLRNTLGIQKLCFCKRSFTKASLLCANLRFAAARSQIGSRSDLAYKSVAFVSKHLGIQKLCFCKRSFTKAKLLCANRRFAAAVLRSNTVICSKSYAFVRVCKQRRAVQPVQIYDLQQLHSFACKPSVCTQGFCKQIVDLQAERILGLAKLTQGYAGRTYPEQKRYRFCSALQNR